MNGKKAKAIRRMINKDTSLKNKQTYIWGEGGNIVCSGLRKAIKQAKRKYVKKEGNVNLVGVAQRLVEIFVKDKVNPNEFIFPEHDKPILLRRKK